MFFRSSWNDVNMKSALQNLEGNAPSTRRRYRSSGNVWVTGAETPGDVTSQVTVEQGYTQAPDHVLRCPAPSHTQLRQFNTNGPLIHVPSFLCVLGSLLYQLKWSGRGAGLSPGFLQQKRDLQGRLRRNKRWGRRKTRAVAWKANNMVEGVTNY